MTTESKASIADITDILVANHDFLVGDGDTEETAQEWAETGLDLDEIKAYTTAGCFNAYGAAELHGVGISPADASKRHVVGGYQGERYGYQVSNRDMTAADVAFHLYC